MYGGSKPPGRQAVGRLQKLTSGFDRKSGAEDARTPNAPRLQNICELREAFGVRASLAPLSAARSPLALTPGQRGHWDLNGVVEF